MDSSITSVRLTQMCHSGGCGCKLSPELLQKILRQLPLPDSSTFPALVVGNRTADDAAVLDTGQDSYLLFTTDFFLPIVDDPFDFGQIAAANALSDIYAMGGTPVAALALVGWPLSALPPEQSAEVVAAILQGAQRICHQAAIPIAGGHSIDNPEPLFGLAVIGTVSKAQLRTNAGALPGDLLFLTKPLGIGIYGAALKKGVLTAEDYQYFLETTTQLNSIGSELSRLPAVHAMTDVTGFGLLGHLLEMCRASKVSAQLWFANLPQLPNVAYYRQIAGTPGGTKRNWQSYAANVSELTSSQRDILCDPQTSGGLLLAVAPEFVEDIRALLARNSLISIQPIGSLHPEGTLPNTIVVVSESDISSASS